MNDFKNKIYTEYQNYKNNLIDSYKDNYSNDFLVLEILDNHALNYIVITDIYDKLMKHTDYDNDMIEEMMQWSDTLLSLANIFFIMDFYFDYDIEQLIVATIQGKKDPLL